MPKFISREQARKNGLVRFFNGRICKRGHVAERYTSIGKCVICAKIELAKSKKNYPDRWVKYRATQAKKKKEQYHTDAHYRARLLIKQKEYREVNGLVDLELRRVSAIRQEVISNGIKRYFTGRPCKHGHIAERLTISGECVQCCYNRKKRLRENPAIRLREYELNKEYKRNGPKNPKGEIQWLRKNQAMLLSVKRFLKNKNRSLEVQP